MSAQLSARAVAVKLLMDVAHPADRRRRPIEAIVPLDTADGLRLRRHRAEIAALHRVEVGRFLGVIRLDETVDDTRDQDLVGIHEQHPTPLAEGGADVACLRVTVLQERGTRIGENCQLLAEEFPKEGDRAVVGFHIENDEAVEAVLHKGGDGLGDDRDFVVDDHGDVDLAAGYSVTLGQQAPLKASDRCGRGPAPRPAARRSASRSRRSKNWP